MLVTPFEVATLEGWRPPDLIREGDFVLGLGSRFTGLVSLPPFWSRVQRIQQVRYVDPVFRLPMLFGTVGFTNDSEILTTNRTQPMYIAVPVKRFLQRSVVYPLSTANVLAPSHLREYELPHDLEKMMDWKVRRLKTSHLWSCWNNKGEERISEYPSDSWYSLSREAFTRILERAFDLDLSAPNAKVELSHAIQYHQFLGHLQLLCFFYGYGSELETKQRIAVLRIEKKATYEYNTQYRQLAASPERFTDFYDGLVWNIQAGFRYVVMRVMGIPFIIKSFVEVKR